MLILEANNNKLNAVTIQYKTCNPTETLRLSGTRVNRHLLEVQCYPEVFFKNVPSFTLVRVVQFVA